MCHDPFQGKNDQGQVPTGHLTWSSHRLLAVSTVALRSAVPISWIASYVPYTSGDDVSRTLKVTVTRVVQMFF